MNIRARIFARKIALVYRYQRLFVQQAHDKKIGFDEIAKIGKAIEFEDDASWVEDLRTYYDDIDEEVAYLIKQHFAKLKSSEIDFEYLKAVLPCFDEALPRVRELVNARVTSFGFDEMDVMDRVIFVLGVVEFEQIGTPMQVIINEMVELAKRYGDASSSKLINGIGHYLFPGSEKGKPENGNQKTEKKKVESMDKGSLIDHITGRKE